MKRSSAPRKTAALPDSIHHQLNMYAIAAGAAGVGVLTFTNLAEARIVYTPTRVSANNLYLDINNDGINDFVLLAPEYVGCNTRCGITWWSIYGSPSRRANANEVVTKNNYAAALRLGEIYGDWGGDGKGVRNRYLGLKFFVQAKAHYGWARLSVEILKSIGPGGRIKATLTGYAYETIPNKPIIAGKTKGPDVIAVQPEAVPGSLGGLALGRK